jgi:hypothetical protein
MDLPATVVCTPVAVQRTKRTRCSVIVPLASAPSVESSEIGIETQTVKFSGNKIPRYVNRSRPKPTEDGLCWLFFLPNSARARCMAEIGERWVAVWEIRDMIKKVGRSSRRCALVRTSPTTYHVVTGDDCDGAISLDDAEAYVFVGQTRKKKGFAAFDPTVIGKAATDVAGKGMDAWLRSHDPGTFFPETAARVTEIYPAFSFPAHLQHLVDLVARSGVSVAGVLNDFFSGAYDLLPLVMPALRLYGYYTQQFNQQHDAQWRYDVTCKHAAPTPIPRLDFAPIVAAAALRGLGDVGQAKVDPILLELRTIMGEFSDLDRGQNLLLGEAIDQTKAILAHRAVLPRLNIWNGCSAYQAAELSKTFQEFRTIPVTASHPHGIAQSVRRAFEMTTFSEVTRRFPDEAIHFVGASPPQVCHFHNARHNCGPLLSGRDFYRHNFAYSPAYTAAFDAITGNHKFEDCPHPAPGSIIVSLFSAGDIKLCSFVQSMIRNSSHLAFVALNLPVPFLDKRVDRYVDELNGFLYELINGKVHMSFTSGASAGYVNDADCLLSWCSPVPTIEGYNVMVEEVRRFGTSFLLEVRVAPGAQEVQPSIFRVVSDDILILPLCRPSWRREPGRRECTAVPARRFNNLVAFAQTLPPGKRGFEAVANKLRGQLAEVRIGKNVIESRWDLDNGQFTSVVAHAILAAELNELDFAAQFPRLSAFQRSAFERHSPNPLVRYKRYFLDAFTFQLAHKRSPYNRSPYEAALDWLFANELDHGQFENPYHAAGKYRVVNDRFVRADLSPIDFVRDVHGAVGATHDFMQTLGHRFATLFKETVAGPQKLAE